MDNTESRNFLIRYIQNVLLALAFAFANFYNMRAAVFYVTSVMEITDSKFVIIYIVLSALLCLLFYNVITGFAYKVAFRIYASLRIKREGVTPSALVFPVPLRDYQKLLNLYILPALFVIGCVRLIYFYYPYYMAVLEAVIPIVLIVGAGFLCLNTIKRNYLNGKTTTAFYALAIPLTVIAAIFY